ncbi:hypothetical protein RRG08_033533 [Elysia crispata]|uniref:Uncharacterized protein n=1 Tax=Elysia crispata TaxID=231223 RepID=A0AAE0XP45_9GAST|nr:hypothetical protein RRG08_033533 [Elysia crispata]
MTVRSGSVDFVRGLYNSFNKLELPQKIRNQHGRWIVLVSTDLSGKPLFGKLANNKRMSRMAWKKSFEF